MTGPFLCISSNDTFFTIIIVRRNFYRRRSSDEIIRFDLESKKEAVVRKKKYKEHVQYNRIFTVDNKLYYELEGEIYLYDEAGNDVKIVKEEKE